MQGTVQACRSPCHHWTAFHCGIVRSGCTWMETAGQNILNFCSVWPASKPDSVLDMGLAPSTVVPTGLEPSLGPRALELQVLGTSVSVASGHTECSASPVSANSTWKKRVRADQDYSDLVPRISSQAVQGFIEPQNSVFCLFSFAAFSFPMSMSDAHGVLTSPASCGSDLHSSATCWLRICLFIFFIFNLPPTSFILCPLFLVLGDISDSCFLFSMLLVIE